MNDCIGLRRAPLFWGILFAVLLSFSGCGSQKISLPHKEVKRKPIIIFVPGYYGTRLVRESDNRIIWISASEALLGSQPLTLPVSELHLNNTTELRAGSILDSVPVIPFIYSVDVYGSMLDALRTSHDGQAEVLPFTYDWREDLLKAIHKLDTIIRQLRSEGTHEISLVAHSLGGLIVSYYLRYGAQEIESAVETWEGARNVTSVVMAGVPFLGVMNSFRNMNFGITVKLNSSLLTAEAYASFPSSYYTLPLFETDRLLTSQLFLQNNMIRIPRYWEQYEWGLLNNKSILSPEIVSQRASYMSFWLHRSQKFLELLRTPLTTPATPHLPLLYLYAKGRPTLAKGVWIKEDSKGSDSLFFDNREPTPALQSIDPSILYDDGDETVTVRSASLPLAYRQTFRTKLRVYEVGHTELVTNTDIQKDIIAFLE